MRHKGHAGKDSLLPPFHLSAIVSLAFGRLHKEHRQHSKEIRGNYRKESSPSPQKKNPQGLNRP
jgi:hypothetical protein